MRILRFCSAKLDLITARYRPPLEVVGRILRLQHSIITHHSLENSKMSQVMKTVASEIGWETLK